MLNFGDRISGVAIGCVGSTCAHRGTARRFIVRTSIVSFVAFSKDDWSYTV